MVLSENQSTEERVKSIISQVARVDRDLITDTASLRNDLWLDSLQAIQILSQIEAEYGVEIDEVEIFNVDSLAEIIDLIAEYDA